MFPKRYLNLPWIYQQKLLQQNFIFDYFFVILQIQSSRKYESELLSHSNNLSQFLRLIIQKDCSRFSHWFINILTLSTGSVHLWRKLFTHHTDKSRHGNYLNLKFKQNLAFLRLSLEISMPLWRTQMWIMFILFKHFTSIEKIRSKEKSWRRRK